MTKAPAAGRATLDDLRARPADRTASASAFRSTLHPRLAEGKVVKNRVHLDVRVGTGLVVEERLAALEAEEARLIPLGAVRVLLQLADEENESCLTMQDIEGNEFGLD
jgi:hypothetical protein